MDMKVRAKFIVDEVTRSRYNPLSAVVKLSPVCADEVEENQRFHEATPTGEITMHITRKEVADNFPVGKEFYVDFIAVPEKTNEA
ncbi:MAG: hypothetical protein COA96_16960 [SAR86 cluster bacterium]|uniref:Uncharacterized protein n=1 Tax=SAR86 cluster bacterium TaxID=2030880 RepID=A0A2A5AGD0_9GAMM|nr:MAG: hypothetical protein COA96_16960 [SAR86 cluster bacterium]